MNSLMMVLLLFAAVLSVSWTEKSQTTADVVIAIDSVRRYNGDKDVGEAQYSSNLVRWIVSVANALPLGPKRVAIVRVDENGAKLLLPLKDGVTVAAVREAVMKIEPITSGEPLDGRAVVGRVRDVAFKESEGNRPDVSNVVIMIALANDPSSKDWRQESWVQEADVAVVVESYASPSDMIIPASPVLQSTDKTGAESVADQVDQVLAKCDAFLQNPEIEWKPCDCETGKQTGVPKAKTSDQCKRMVDTTTACKCADKAGDDTRKKENGVSSGPMAPWLIIVVVCLIILTLIITAALIGYFAVAEPRRRRHRHHRRMMTMTARIQSDKASERESRTETTAALSTSTTPPIDTNKTKPTGSRSSAGVKSRAPAEARNKSETPIDKSPAKGPTSADAKPPEK